MTSSRSNGHAAGRGTGNGAAHSPFEEFLADVADLASSVDEELAAIILAGEPAAQARLPWSGGRRRGLELCLTMLRYAREDVASEELSRRLDDAISYTISALDEALDPVNSLQ